MADDPFIRKDESVMAESNYCPVMKSDCLREKCQWWVMDYQEEKKAYRMDCAVSIIAKGLTDETLLRLKK